MRIVARAWATYQQLLITHPWKTQTIGTGKIEKSNKLNETAKKQNKKKHKHHQMRKLYMTNEVTIFQARSSAPLHTEHLTSCSQRAARERVI